MTTPKRSKRQLYIGIFFITAAILAALLRSIGSSSPAGSSDFIRVDDLIGISTQQATDRLGEPTARLSFNPADESSALRVQVVERLTQSGQQVPETMIELSWFDASTVTTVWFIAADPADDASYRSIDSVRYSRPPAEQPSGTPLD
jgi:hypothetical protein